MGCIGRGCLRDGRAVHANQRCCGLINIAALCRDPIPKKSNYMYSYSIAVQSCCAWLYIAAEIHALCKIDSQPTTTWRMLVVLRCTARKARPFGSNQGTHSATGPRDLFSVRDIVIWFVAGEQIAVAKRGGCNFVDKALRCQAAGALALVIQLLDGANRSSLPTPKGPALVILPVGAICTALYSYTHFGTPLTILRTHICGRPAQGRPTHVLRVSILNSSEQPRTWLKGPRALV